MLSGSEFPSRIARGLFGLGGGGIEGAGGCSALIWFATDIAGTARMEPSCAPQSGRGGVSAKFPPNVRLKGSLGSYLRSRCSPTESAYGLGLQGQVSLRSVAGSAGQGGKPALHPHARSVEEGCRFEF
jgi:hypothetical protein